MQTKHRALLMILILLGLVGCSAATSTSAPGPVVSTPSGGNGAVTGRVLSVPKGQPFVDEYVFLAAVNYNDQGEGAYFLDSAHSPTTKTNENGFFQFKDIPPQDYVFVVGDPMGSSAILTDKSTGNPKIWKVEAGKILDLGEIRIDLGR